jgi:hypothetical protein
MAPEAWRITGRALSAWRAKVLPFLNSGFNLGRRIPDFRPI